MALTQTQVSQLYVSIFNRASEGNGNTYWQTNGADLASVATQMLATTDAATYFGTSLNTNQAFVEHIYLNTLNKTLAQDPTGIAYWVAELDSGVSRGQMVANLVTAATEAANAGAAQDQFNNRVTVSNYMADTVAAAPSDYATSTSFSSGLTVTSDAATVTTAQAAVDDIANPGQTFSLTTATTDNIVGAATDDTITAVNSSLLSEGTLQVSDKIDGAAGTDTINISMKQSFTGFTTGSMTNVETVNLTNNSTAAMSFDATGVTGVTKYALTNNVSGVNNTLSDVASLADVEVSGTAGTSTLAVGYTATSTVATGTQTDVQNLKVTNVGTIDTDATSATNAKYMTVDIDKVETLAITTAGTSNSLDLSASADTKTITVAGEGTTEINAVDDTVTSFDASAATGKVIVNSLAAAASNTLTTVKTGSGDDTVKVVADDLTANATIAGGTGADTLAFLAGAGKTLQATMTGFETINVGAISTTDLTFSGTNATDIATINVEGLTNAGIDAFFVNMKATALTMNSIGANTQDVSADNAAAITYNLNAAAATTTAGTTADANSSDATFSGATGLTVNVGQLVAAAGTITANAATSLTVNNASKVVNSNELNEMSTAITAGSATSVTLDSDGRLVTGAALNIAKATTLTLNTGSTAAEADVITIDAPKLTTLNVTAAQNLAITEATVLGDNKGLGSIQNLTVTTNKAFSFAGNYLDDVASVTVGGTATTSAASLGTLGAAALTHNISVTATGLKAGLTTGTITTDTGAVTLNVSGVTGNVEIGNVTADAGITVTATNLVGTLDATTASTYTTTTGDISIDVSNATSATQFGTLTTNGGTSGGSVTVNAASAMSTTTVGVITGKNVTVDGTSALGAVLVGNGTTGGTDILANGTVTYKGTNLTANGVDIEGDATSTALSVALTGGALAEGITVTGGVAQNSITVSGNLGAGTNSVTVTLVDNNTADATSTTGQTVNLSGLTGSSNTTTTTSTVLTAEADSAITYTGSAMNDTITMAASNSKAISITDATTTDTDTLVLDASGGAVTLTTLTLSGISDITVESTNAMTINASAISAQAIDFGATGGAGNTDTLTLTGTAGADVIDLSNATTSVATSEVNFNITGSAGNDTVVLSAAGVSVETLTFTDTSKDTVTSFKTTEDNLKFDGITLTGGGAIAATTGTAVTAGTTTALTDDVIHVIADGATSLKTGGSETITDYTSLTDVAAYLAERYTSTADNDAGIFVINDLVGDKTYVYAFDEQTAGASTIASTDLTLIGVITETSGSALVTGDIA